MDPKQRVFLTFRFAFLLLAIGMVGCASAPIPFRDSSGTKDATTEISRNSQALLGSWKLVSLVYEFQDGRPAILLLGKNPIGYLILTPSGRMSTVLEADGRKPAKTDDERSTLLRTLIAYTGKFRIEGDKWITKVDASWNGTWNGTEQERTYRLDGDKLFVISMWQPNSTMTGNPVARAILEWEREK